MSISYYIPFCFKLYSMDLNIVLSITFWECGILCKRTNDPQKWSEILIECDAIKWSSQSTFSHPENDNYHQNILHISE